MNTQFVLEKISHLYPHAQVVLLPQTDPQEIICEYEPTALHADWSQALAVIDCTTAHYHRQTTETYEVLDGKLVVFVDGKTHELVAGQQLTIFPNQIHSAKGEQTWVRVTSKPGWLKEDHLLAGDNQAAI